MASMHAFYPESIFGGFTNVDGTVLFYNRINSLLASSFVVLDAGCGRGAWLDDPVTFRRDLRLLKGKVKKVIGIDPDPGAGENPSLDEFRQTCGNEWPLENGSVDLVFCDHVLEHVLEPEIFLSQASRVLKKGGYLCLRTPNAWNYIALISRLVPNRFHSKITTAVQEKRRSEDVFPTHYRCNTIRKIRTLLKAQNFHEQVVFGYEAEPSYLSFSRFAYWLGVLHQKYAPRSLRTTIIAFARKSGPDNV